MALTTKAEKFFDFDHNGELDDLEKLAVLGVFFILPIAVFLAVFRALGPR